MPRVVYVLEGIFFLALAGVCIYAAIALESPQMLIPTIICIAVAIFYFYKGLAGRGKDSEVISDLRKRISEVGAGTEEDISQDNRPESPHTDESEIEG